MDETQVCRKCKTEKPISDFPRNKAITKGAHPGVDPMCKQCWKDGRKARQDVVAGAKEAGVAVPKRSKKAAAKVAADGSETGAEEAPASSEELEGVEVDPAKVVPTIVTEVVDGHSIDVINHPTKPSLNEKQWHRGLIGPFEDVVKFFSDVFGHWPEKVVKFKSTYFFPLSDEDSDKARGIR